MALLQQGRRTPEASKLLGTSQSTSSRIRRECVPYMEPSSGGRKITIIYYKYIIKYTYHINIIKYISNVNILIHELSYIRSIY